MAKVSLVWDEAAIQKMGASGSRTDSDSLQMMGCHFPKRNLKC